MRWISGPYRRFFLSILCIGILPFLPKLEAQDSLSNTGRSLSQNEIQDLSELAKYDKTEKKLRAKSKKKQEDKNDDQKSINLTSLFNNGLGGLTKGFLYILIIALIIFILFIIFSSVKVEKKVKPKIINEEEEIEDIEVIDTETGLEKAIKAENYREAVRMLFIKLLQVLVIEDSIAWRPEKTNRDYLIEMKNHKKIRHFENLVMAYESIWYGSEPIDKMFFDYLSAEYAKFYSTENLKPDAKE